MQFAAFLVSAALHILLVILAVVFQDITMQPPIDLDQDIQMVELVYMAQEDPAPDPPEAPAEPEPEPPAEPEPQPVPEPEKPAVEIPDEPDPEPAPDPVPEPEPEPEAKPAPEPEPETAKPEPQAPAEPSPKEKLARELASLQKEVQNSGRTEASSSAGLMDIYVAAARAKIRQNWRFPRMGSTADLVVRIQISLDSTGRIVSSKILRSSGHEDFDNSAMRAVDQTGSLPAPPSSEIRTLVIDFNLQEMQG